MDSRLPEAEESSRHSGLTDTNKNVVVYHTILAKHIRQDPDGELKLICTIIQRCVHPPELKDDFLLQFKYRVNDELFFVDPDSGRIRNVRVKDDENLVATVGTFRVALPLTKHLLWQMYPFRIRVCKTKIELSTTEMNGVNYRPDLHYEVGRPQSFLSVKSDEDLDAMAEYDLMCSTPYVEGEKQQKEGVFYTPVLHFGFYLMDPFILTIINTFLPLFLVLVLLAATVAYRQDQECDDEFLANLSMDCDGNPMQGNDYVAQLTGISLTAVFVLPMLRNTDAARTKISPADIFILLMFGGLVVAAAGTYFIVLRKVGLALSWSAMIIPAIGLIFFRRISKMLSKMDSLGIVKVPKKEEGWFESWGFCMDDNVDASFKDTTAKRNKVSPSGRGARDASPPAAPKPKLKNKGEDVYIRRLVTFTDPDKTADTYWGFTPKLVEKRQENRMGTVQSAEKGANYAFPEATAPSQAGAPHDATTAGSGDHQIKSGRPAAGDEFHSL
eukprot:CAMPEP_0118937994 /NCGR_PEP_ID=MMETSP1169-20130426/24471_1 /TAXON_ID=36882 /ORGANISM="Pyramimonas obovata, Strain CCMP722" /LENGTH=498 /DNA_ID=CAMNT_0006881803 /DNA_START=280 /DNA_END=1776 /DNA_ORIENTATION=+